MYDTYLNKFRAHQGQITDHAALNMRIGNPKRCADDANTGKRRQPAASCSCSVQLQHMGGTEGARKQAAGRRIAERHVFSQCCWRWLTMIKARELRKNSV